MRNNLLNPTTHQSTQIHQIFTRHNDNNLLDEIESKEREEETDDADDATEVRDERQSKVVRFLVRETVYTVEMLGKQIRM